MYREEKKKIAYRIFPFLVSSALMLSSCGFASNEEAYSISYNTVVGGNEKLSMENAPVLEYTVPEMIPGVLVDCDGYSRNEIIYALICSKKLPEKYYVYKADSGKAAFVGVPEEVMYDEETLLYTAKLYFEDIDEDGEYYIYADGLGSSYSFNISSTYYQDIYWNLIESECDRIKNGEAGLWETYSVLYSYERYKDVLYGIKEDAPDVLGAVGAWISCKDFDSLTGADGYLGIAILSKFGYNYKAVESSLATECIQKASALYKEHGKWENDEEQKAAYLALSELYRTSAMNTYALEILSMKDYLTSSREVYDSGYILYGAMGYMTTRQSVNRELCDSMMENLLYKCRDLNDDKKLARPDSAAEADSAKLLMYAQQFAAMNYILDGYEYNEQILNIEHFLSGRNTEAYVYNIAEKSIPDAVAIYAWLAWLENNGKLDPSAPVKWNYSW